MNRLAPSYALLMSVVPTINLLVPLRLQELGVDDTAELALWVGWLFAAGVGASAVMAPIWGRVADAIGPKWMLLRASIGLALACVLYTVADTPEQLLFTRLFQGVMSGVQPAAYAMGATLRREQQAGTLATLSAFGNVGRIVGPALMLIATGLLQIDTVFFALLTLCLAGCVAVSTLADARVPVRTKHPPESSASAGVDRRFPILGLGLFAASSRALVEQLLPVLVSSYGMPVAQQAPWLAILHAVNRGAALLSASRWGRLIDVRGFRHGAWISSLGMTASIGLLALLGGSWTSVLAMTLFGTAASGMHIATVTGMVTASNEATATAVGLEASAARVGAMGGTVGLGWLISVFGLSTTLGLAGGLCAALALALRGAKERPARA